MNADEARRFAVEWIAAWNSRDLDRILSHYANDIVLLSPLAEKLVGDGRVVGMAALRSYWALGLAAQPNLKFDLIEVGVGHQCLTVLYRNHRDQQGAETFEFGAGDKVVRSFALRMDRPRPVHPSSANLTPPAPCPPVPIWLTAVFFAAICLFASFGSLVLMEMEARQLFPEHRFEALPQ